MVPWDHAGLRGGRAVCRSVKLCVGFAPRSGALEICINPSKGLYISRIKKIAPETDSAQTNRVAIAVALRGANKPKLLKIVASQKTSTASNGIEMKLPPHSNIIHLMIAGAEAWGRYSLRVEIILSGYRPRTAATIRRETKPSRFSAECPPLLHPINRQAFSKRRCLL
jgi:hypothetical protein